MKIRYKDMQLFTDDGVKIDLAVFGVGIAGLLFAMWISWSLPLYKTIGMAVLGLIWGVAFILISIHHLTDGEIEAEAFNAKGQDSQRSLDMQKKNRAGENK